MYWTAMLDNDRCMKRSSSAMPGAIVRRSYEPFGGALGSQELKQVLVAVLNAIFT